MRKKGLSNLKHEMMLMVNNYSFIWFEISCFCENANTALLISLYAF